MFSRELLDKGEKALERDLDKLFSKTELSPADWDAVKKAICIANMIECCRNGESYDENGMSYGQYSGSDGYYDGMSGARSRSPVTGRYISRGYSDDHMMHGYSGHSIEDRMIMALEQQMDGAKTDYERQLVEKEIQRIRRGDR